jgi:hypothetical protein
LGIFYRIGTRRDSADRSSVYSESLEVCLSYVAQLGTIVAAYGELERRTELVSTAPGAKRAMVQDAINHFLGQFTIKDVERACPTVGRDMIRLVLKELRAEGRIEPVGKGRGAKWKRMG